MAIPFVPRIKVQSVLDIRPELLAARGIKLLLLDLDNTLAPYSGTGPTEEIFAWRDALRAAGVEPFIVSNTKTDRAKNFAAQWQVEHIHHARKPFGDGVARAMASRSARVGETALAGDQLFTDVWAANRAGILSIVVQPLELKNIFRALRYVAELPFRAMGGREKL